MFAGHEGYAPSSGDVRIQVAGQPVQDVVVTLSPGATIHGTVSGMEPDDLAHVRVRALRSDGEGFAESGVGREGGYSLTDLAPGEWTVTATHADSGRQARDRVTIEPGALEAIAAKLARARINIDYVYGSTGKSASATVVLSVSNLTKAAKVVGG